ncbi:MAG TPA: DUF2891 domain-containing protein [Bryobacteraceae bacterium]
MRVLPTILAAAVPLLMNAATPALPALDAHTAGRFAQLALDCVHREYPTKIAHLMNSAADAKTARELTPAFYGCFDWHSSVHGHWLLARLAHQYPEADFTPRVRAALAQSLTKENLAGEAAYISAPGRAGFERPYGLAWLLQLASELRHWDDPQAQQWSHSLEPLESSAIAALTVWLPKLTHPVRSGEHSSTAFSMGLLLDYAASNDHPEFHQLLERKARDFYLQDRACPISYEPSGEDFLSPCIAEADVMRRVLPRDEFSAWLAQFLPDIPKNGTSTWLAPGVVADPSDGKLAHLDGLNLSRAWMLDRIATALPSADARIASLRATARLHADDGLRAVTGAHYEGGHWLGTFAVYLLSK